MSGAVGIVVVSHSAALARACLELVEGLVPGLDVEVRLAAGLPDGSLGTDATVVLEAMEALGSQPEAHVLVLADVGSGVMSAMTALELADPELAQRCELSPAPLVEGLLAAYAAAGTGQDFTAVCAQARQAAADKQALVEGA